MPACGHVLQTADELASANIPRAVERESAACVLAAQRGFELLNPETRGKRWGNWRLIFIAERSGLLRRMERHCAMPR